MTGIIAVPHAITGRDAALIKAVVSGIIPELRAQFEAEFAPLKARLAELEGRSATDNVDMADALIDHDGRLVLTLSDGRTKALGVVVGRNGDDGKPGDTFTLDDFDLEPIDERTVKLCFTRGETMHSFELEFPIPIYRGVFREDGEYRRGDLVTWAGSMWHCDEPTGAKPRDGEKGWTLAVKAGRPGKDAGK